MRSRLLRFAPLAIALVLFLSCGLPVLRPATQTTLEPTVEATATEVAAAESTPTVVPTEAAGQTGQGKQLRQWASSASASSQYDDPEWSANQATGAPDTPECSDYQTAWAAASKDTQEWLEVGFANPVLPTQINIVQTYNPSRVVKVELIDPNGGYHEVYKGEPKQADACPYTLSINVKGADYEAVGVRISIDQSVIGQWNEIDAVELVGTYGGSSPIVTPAKPTVEPTSSGGSSG